MIGYGLAISVANLRNQHLRGAGAGATNNELREDGSVELREDGGKELRE